LMNITLTTLNSIGLIVNMIGGFWYSYIKYKEQTEKQKQGARKEDV